MHLVMAVLKPSQVEGVRRALAAVNVSRMTICDVQGWQERGDGLRQETLLEIAVNDDFLGPASEAIAAAVEAGGGTAAGRLFTLPMTEAVQLYRDVRGPEAI